MARVKAEINIRSVSDSRARQIADALIKPKVTELSKLEVQMNNELETYISQLIPKNVKELSNQYPGIIKKLSSECFYYSSKNYRNYVYLDANKSINLMALNDSNGSLHDYVKKDTLFYSKFSELLKTYGKVCDERDVLVKQIICILTKLRTVPKIKKEYPEAYNVLVGIVKKENGHIIVEETSSLCDSIENVRAKLK